VAKRYPVCNATADKVVEEIPPGTACGLLQIAWRKRTRGAVEFQTQLARQTGYESLVFFRCFAAQLVIEVRYARELDSKAWSNFAECVQQAHRVGAAGYGRDDARACRQHIVAGDGREDSVQHSSIITFDGYDVRRVLRLTGLLFNGAETTRNWLGLIREAEEENRAHLPGSLADENIARTYRDLSNPLFIEHPIHRSREANSAASGT